MLEQKKPNKALRPLIGAVALLLVALVGYLEFAPKPKPEEIPLTAEATAYIRNLALQNVDMTAKLDYFSQKVVEITGEIGNTGGRNLKLVEVNCVFRDYANQVVLRQRSAIVSAKMGGLKPGETKPFRLPFDEVPANWNQQLPQLVIAGIEFE